MNMKAITWIFLSCSVLQGLPNAVKIARNMQKCERPDQEVNYAESQLRCQGGQTVVLTVHNRCICRSVIAESELCKLEGGCLVGVLFEGDKLLTIFDEKCPKGSACYFARKKSFKADEKKATMEIPEIKQVNYIPLGTPCPKMSSDPLKQACYDGIWKNDFDPVILNEGEMTISVALQNDQSKRVLSIMKVKDTNVGEPCQAAYCKCSVSKENNLGNKIYHLFGTSKTIDYREPPIIKLNSERIAVPAGFLCEWKSTENVIGFGEQATTSKFICRASLFPNTVPLNYAKCTEGQVCGANLSGSQCVDVIDAKPNAKKYKPKTVEKKEGQMFAVQFKDPQGTSTSLPDPKPTHPQRDWTFDHYTLFFCFHDSKLEIESGQATCVRSEKTMQLKLSDHCLNRKESCQCSFEKYNPVSCGLGQICGFGEYLEGGKFTKGPICLIDFDYVECPLKSSCNCYPWSLTKKKPENEKHLASEERIFCNVQEDIYETLPTKINPKTKKPYPLLTDEELTKRLINLLQPSQFVEPGLIKNLRRLLDLKGSSDQPIVV